MANLVQTVTPLLTADLVKTIATSLGIDPSKLQSALMAALAADLDALIRLGSTNEGADQLLTLLPSGVDDVIALLHGVDGLQYVRKFGSDATIALFGDSRRAIIECVAATSGISTNSAESVLNCAALMVLGSLSKEVTSQNLNAATVGAYLNDQRSAGQQVAPSEFARCLESKTGAGTVAGVAAAKVSSYAPPEEASAPPPPPAAALPLEPPPPPKRSRQWLWWLLGLLVLLGLLGWLLRSYLPTTPAVAPAPTVAPATTEPGAATPLTATDTPIPAADTPVAAGAPVTATGVATSAAPVTSTSPVTVSAQLVTDTTIITSSTGVVTP